MIIVIIIITKKNYIAIIQEWVNLNSLNFLRFSLEGLVEIYKQVWHSTVRII